MKPRSLLILGLVTVAVVIAAVVVDIQRYRATAPAEAHGLIYPALAEHLDNVTTVLLRRPGSSVTLNRTAKGWTVAERAGYPADFGKVRRLLVALGELSKLEAKTNSPKLYPDLQVEDPTSPHARSTEVTLKTAKGTVLASLIVGKSKPDAAGPGNDGVYVRKAGEARSWLAQGTLSVSGGPAEWIDKKLMDISRTRVATVTIHPAQGAPLVVERAHPTDADFTIEGLPADAKLKGTYMIDAIGGVLENLSADDVRTDADVPLPANPTTTEIHTFDGLTVTATLTDKDGKAWVRLHAASQPPAAAPQATNGDAAASPAANRPAAGRATDSTSAGAKAATPAPKLETPAEVAKEAARINATCDGWAYALPAYQAHLFERSLSQLLEPAGKKP